MDVVAHDPRPSVPPGLDRPGTVGAPQRRTRTAVPCLSGRRSPYLEDHMYDMIEYPSTPDTDDEIARALQDALNRRC
ncbi:hypothetical protein B005_3007 [Nocardiopsis alba ATCC BAA-2165]|uniref:Uncharacterized protein n=1 Tax=Nocardiopsis alba (strain ATCC BAA-2165 / BE74) TaxID=1205910 RepID=J7L7Y8_NOCAA|nr:hypothetical protein B005_3007 [Nocardiopsis alba ATCC BAA-2165]